MGRPVVAIIGRPNVGKSTLFNRIVGSRIAIVEDTPGITRDRLYASTDWNAREFVLVDTGGITPNRDDPLTAQIKLQADVAIEEADVIVFVVDVTEGLTSDDIDVAEMLRRTDKPVLLASNKADNTGLEQESLEFYSLGLGNVYPISSVQGRGVADLLDEIVNALPEEKEADDLSEDAIKIAIIGRPNVGKSSLLNAIVKEERSIVSNIPGTTRDAIDTYFKHGDQDIVLIDTAGIRRAGKVQQSVEYYSVLRAARAIERCDIALLVIDADEGLSDGDKRVAGYANEAGKALVIVVNKWDLMKGKGIAMRKFAEDMRSEAGFISYATIVFASAKTGRGIGNVLDSAIQAAQNHAMRLSTSEVNRIIHDAVDQHPFIRRGKQFKVYYATMPVVKPPTIAIFANDPSMMHFSYIRYLENQVRKEYPYEGTPIRIQIRKAEGKTKSG